MSDGNTTTGVHLAGADRPCRPGQRTVWMNFIEPGWFETYGMRVVAGRDFAASDTAGVRAGRRGESRRLPATLPAARTSSASRSRASFPAE